MLQAVLLFLNLACCLYLINSPRDDGIWHVVTHAKPIRTYYESGFPHTADQFISITATARATLALTGSQSEAKAVAEPKLIEEKTCIYLAKVKL